MIETNAGKEFNNNIFQKFLINNNIKDYSRNTYLGAVFPERFNRTIRDILKTPVFEKGDSTWIDILPTATKQCNKRKQSSIKLTSIQANLEKNEGYVYRNLLGKRQKFQPKFQVNDLVRTADLKKTFSKSNLTNWSDKLYKNTEIINDTIPTSKIDNLQERHNEASLKKTELTMKEHKDVMKALILN